VHKHKNKTEQGRRHNGTPRFFMNCQQAIHTLSARKIHSKALPSFGFSSLSTGKGSFYYLYYLYKRINIKTGQC